MKSLFLVTFIFLVNSFVVWSQNQKEDMKSVVEYLASDKLKGRETGSKQEKMAAKYLAKEFKKMGILAKGEKGYYQDFTYTPKPNAHAAPSDSLKTYSPVTGRNVIGYIDNGAEFTTVIGAHYDHLGMGAEGSRSTGAPEVHNGADDNASGVAVILELAKYLKENKTDHNYLILAFSGEEKGLWGSNYYMKNPTIDTSKISYMLNYDMVGRLGDSYKLAIYGVGTSPVFDSVIKQANNPVMFHIVTTESGVGPSDHTSFYLKGYPVLHFFTGQHEDYHKPSDDADKINFEGMEMIYTYSQKIISSLDKIPKLAYQKTKDEDSNKAPKYSVTLGVVPDYLYDGKGMRIDGTSSGKPAELAGIKSGDVIVKMGELEITDMMAYMKALGQFKKGDQIDVTVIRAEQEIVLPVVF